MNTKQALEKCFEYFLDPKHKAGYRAGSGCVYYANGGNPTMCAIGCLLPAKFQKRAGTLEGGITSLFIKFPEIEQFFGDTDTMMLGNMQNAHDEWALGRASREDFLDDLQNLMGYNDTCIN